MDLFGWASRSSKPMIIAKQLGRRRPCFPIRSERDDKAVLFVSLVRFPSSGTGELLVFCQVLQE